MSATLGGGLAQDLQHLMAGSQATGSLAADVPVVISEGRSYPVITHYLGKPRE